MAKYKKIVAIFLIVTLILLPILFTPSLAKLSSLLKKVGWPKVKSSLTRSFSNRSRELNQSISQLLRSNSCSKKKSLAIKLGRSSSISSTSSSSSSQQHHHRQSLHQQYVVGDGADEHQRQQHSEVELPTKCKCLRQELLANMQLIEEELQLYASDESFASGSHGTIYHGYYGNLGHCVAIKAIHYAQNKVLHDLAAQEAKSYEVMNGKGVKRVVKMFGSFDFPEHQIYFLILEIGDYSLREYWDYFSPKFSSEEEKINEIKTLTKHLLNPLIELHHFGILHMDVKMQNALMFERRLATGIMQSKTKIIDFGGAQFTNSKEIDIFIKPDVFVGTSSYRSPEHRLHKIYHQLMSCKSDVWSIGTILYTMLMGETPNVLFENAADYQQVKNMMLELGGFLRTFVGQWSRGKKILYKPLLHMAKACLHADPEQRPLAYQLMAYLHGWCRLGISELYGKEPARAYDGTTNHQLIQCNEMSYQKYEEMAIGHASLKVRQY